MQTAVQESSRIIGTYGPNVIAALLILFFGWVAAEIISRLVRAALHRANVDDRVSQSLGTGARGTENLVTKIVFWLIMLFVLIGFFQALNLPGVTEPLTQFLNQIAAYLPRVFWALVLFIVAWVLATFLRRLVVGVLGRVDADRRLSGMVSGDDESAAPASSGPEQVPPTATSPESVPPAATDGEPGPAAESRQAGLGGVSIAQAVGDVVYWLVFLLFLPAVLDALALGGLLLPVQVMITRVLAYLPNVAAAALIFLAGWFAARLVQRIATGLLAALGLDRLGERVGLSQVLGGQTLSGLVGLLVYILILIPVLIAALDALAIEAISQPAINMLNTVLAAIPNIFAAAAVLIIAWVVGRLVAGLVSSLLAGIGFDAVPARLGVTTATTVGTRTPSDLVGGLILVSIMLFAAAEAAGLLGFGVLTVLLAQFIVLAGQILLGLIIFGLGLYLARLVADAIRGTGARQADWLALAARVAIIALAAAMALRQMGIANEIVNLAFGLLLGAVAVAAALAFGLGGRETAGRELEAWVEGVKARRALSGPQGAPSELPGSTAPRQDPAPAPGDPPLPA